MFKRFLDWIILKEKLHSHTYKPPLFKEGEIWWCSFGENIGNEINGKSDVFTRPALIYKKLSANIFMAIPTTSQERMGTWYVPVTLGSKKSFVVLSQARVVDYKRLFSKIGELSDLEMDNVTVKFHDLYR
jgi:mRNA-degrading endonuclease toxin of MazEF toxin-antitoxin module